MVRRHYSSNARETSLTAGINNSATTIAVDSPVGYPADVPFVVHCELGTSSEEIMLVTAVVGSNWTVTRGYDGSTAVSHDTGAKIVHGVAAIDMDEANDHVNASTNVHGLAGGAAVVGTTSTQTLTNKTLTSPTINGGTWTSPSLSNPTFSGGTLTNTTLVTPTIASFTNAQHNHTNAAGGGTLDLGGGDSGTFFFGSPVSASAGWSTPLAGGNVDDMVFTYTAPAAWPDDASGVQYNFTVFVVESAGEAFDMNFTNNGSNIISSNLDFAMSLTTTQTFTFSWVGPLTTVATSHTARVRASGSVNNAVEFRDRQFWLSLV